MFIRSILNLNEIKDVIKELYELYEVINGNINKEKFEVSFFLSKYLKMEFNDVYGKLERKKEMEYELNIEMQRYSILSDWEIEEELKEDIKERIKLNEDKEKYIFLTKSIIEEEIKTKGEVIDFTTITEGIMELKGVADNIYLNYKDYKKTGMSTWENGRLLFVNAKNLIDMNEDEMKKEDMFSQNIRGYEGGKKSVIKSIVQTIKKNNSKLMLGNNGLTMICEKVNIRDDIGEFELIT